jgi:Cys-tRNA(Pro)/Cys-tRNA(Cys) deacylase
MRTSVDVHNALVEREIPHELVRVRGRLRHPDRIAGILGLASSQVGRVLLYRGEHGVVAALLPSDRDPDPARIARGAGTDSLRAVTPARASDLTGFLYEALPPVPLPRNAAVLMDRSLSRQEVLYFPGGEASTVLKIRGPDLAKATGAKVLSLGRPRRG